MKGTNCELLIASAMALLAAGCGGSGVKTYPVSGTVKFADGSPVTAGMVQFRPVSGPEQKLARGDIQPDGGFVLGTFDKRDGAVAGDYEVAVLPPPYSGDRDDIDPSKVPEPIAVKFQRFDSSGLRHSVEPTGKNSFDIVVERGSK